MKKHITKIALFLVLLFTITSTLVLVPVSAAEETAKYTFSEYTAGTQYAENEEHVLDENVTVYTTESHFTTQLRLYSSDQHNGFAIFESKTAIKSLVLNIGNKKDTLNVYTSTDGTTWTLAEEVEVTATSYNDYTVDFSEATKFIKLDVAGSNQLRIAYVQATFAAASGEETCTHANTEKIAAVAPTCTESGLTEGTKCADCGEIIETQKKVNATGHNYVNYECSVCGDKVTVSPISTALSGEKNDVFSVKGIATFVDGKNVYIQDETGAIVVYLTNDQADALGVKVGDEVEAINGTLDIYNGLIEVKNCASVTVKSSGNTLPAAKEVTLEELAAEDAYTKYANQLVVIKNVTLGATDGNNTTLTDGTNSVVIYKMAEFEGVAEGDAVDVTAVVSIYKTLQLRAADVSAYVPPVNGDASVASIVISSFAVLVAGAVVLSAKKKIEG